MGSFTTELEEGRQTELFLSVEALDRELQSTFRIKSASVFNGMLASTFSNACYLVARQDDFSQDCVSLYTSRYDCQLSGPRSFYILWLICHCTDTYLMYSSCHHVLSSSTIALKLIRYPQKSGHHCDLCSVYIIVRLDKLTNWALGLGSAATELALDV